MKEKNTNLCPGCDGEADNGYDRCSPPNMRECLWCTAQRLDKMVLDLVEDRNPSPQLVHEHCIGVKTPAKYARTVVQRMLDDNTLELDDNLKLRLMEPREITRIKARWKRKIDELPRKSRPSKEDLQNAADVTWLLFYVSREVEKEKTWQDLMREALQTSQGAPGDAVTRVLDLTNRMSLELDEVKKTIRRAAELKDEPSR